MKVSFRSVLLKTPSIDQKAYVNSMQPGDDSRDRKRAGDDNSASNIRRRPRVRRRGDAAAAAAAAAPDDDDVDPAQDETKHDPTDRTTRFLQPRGALHDEEQAGFATTAIELERQLREQTLLNQFLQNRRLGRPDSQAFDPRFESRYDPMLPPSSFHRLQQPPPYQHLDALRYNPDLEVLARQASDRALGFASAAGLDYSDRGQHPSLMNVRAPVDDQRAFSGPGAGSARMPQHQQMLEQALLQQRLAQERSFQYGAGVVEPLSDLERFSRGLGDYAMIHHQRLRDLSLPQRLPTMQPQSLDASARDFRASMDMRSARLPASEPSREPIEEQKSGFSTSFTETNGRPMALRSDVEQLTVYQVLIRRSLEYFVAGETDVATSVRGRKQKIRVGQIGVRCKYCAHVPLRQRSKGAVYYAKSLINVYQAAQVSGLLVFVQTTTNSMLQLD
jgi:hypothetical protein